MRERHRFCAHAGLATDKHTKADKNSAATSFVMLVIKRILGSKGKRLPTIYPANWTHATTKVPQSLPDPWAVDTL